MIQHGEWIAATVHSKWRTGWVGLVPVWSRVHYSKANLGQGYAKDSMCTDDLGYMYV